MAKGQRRGVPVAFGMIRRASVAVRRCRSQRYVGRISGPLLGHIGIHIDVPAVKFRELTVMIRLRLTAQLRFAIA